jgi:hypothetical protein
MARPLRLTYLGPHKHISLRENEQIDFFRFDNDHPGFRSIHGLHRGMRPIGPHVHNGTRSSFPLGSGNQGAQLIWAIRRLDGEDTIRVKRTQRRIGGGSRHETW